MRTFEFKDARSHKFWHITLKGKQFTVTYGRVGAKGQTQAKDFSTAKAAEAAHDKLIAEKTAKGYVEIVPKKPVPPSPLQKSLEAALVADPDDLAAHSAYADYLIEQGDPRGEFIQVQLALEDESRTPAERKELQKQEKALLKQHRHVWLGAELAKYFIDGFDEDISEMAEGGTARGRFGYARGWLDSLTVFDLSSPLIAALARALELRLLRELSVDDFYYADDPDLSVLGRSPHLGNLRVLRLDGRGPNGESAVSLIRKLPRLEELQLMIRDVDARALFGLKTLTRLRVLVLHHLTDYPMEKLAANPAFAALTRLDLWPHAQEPGDREAYLRLPQLRAVVRSPHLGNLTHLEWRVSDIGDAGCQEIVSSGVLKRLKVLELESGCITDAGAAMLAACPDLRSLESLNVARNRLTKAGVTALKNTGVNLQAGHQHSERDAGDYVYEGDCE